MSPMLRAWFAACALALVPCCSSPEKSEVSKGAGRAHEYVLVVLKGSPDAPKLEPEEMKEAMAGHMANIQRLADAGDLLVAGPYGKPNPKPARRGIFVFAGGDVARAKELTATDPALVAGMMVAEAHPLRSDLDFRRAQALDREFMEKSKPGGPNAGAPFPMHEYVLAIVGGGERAGRALATLRGKGVAFSGELGGELEGSHLVMIDAQGAEAAEAVLAPIRGELGEVDASPWWASASLMAVSK